VLYFCNNGRKEKPLLETLLYIHVMVAIIIKNEKSTEAENAE